MGNLLSQSTGWGEGKKAVKTDEEGCYWMNLFCDSAE